MSTDLNQELALQLLRGPARPDLLRDECLPDLLAATARSLPEHPALIWGTQVVTYGALAATSRQASDALVRRGAGPGRIVGLFLPRGADLLISQAAISQSGAAWLPLDAQTPRERVQACLQAADAMGLVTCRDYLPRLTGLSCPIWTLEDLLAEPDSGRQLPPGNQHPDDPAYVIYTSGSTGQPKGIVVSHRSICHFLRSENTVLGVGADDRVYQGFSVAFDMSFEEIWLAYLVGATLWIAPAELVGDPEQLARTLTEQNITVLHAVPTLVGLLDDPLPTVRLINLGGEACPESLVGRLARPGRRVFNTYGPTEATVSASAALLEAGQPVTIGRPLPNYGMMVVDEQRRPLPFGTVGELAIFGPGLATGYLGQPELTAQRFVNNPLAEALAESRLYLTGDLGRMDPDGLVHCLGRADDQIKIRGYRVELGEIEAVLAGQPGVATAAAAVCLLAGMEQVVGFVVPTADGEPELAALRQALSSCLPPYMVPAHFEVVSQLPRLASGKIDRKRLRELPLYIALPRQGIASAPARNEDEAALHAALQTLFPGAELHPDADFFDDLGGHSLLAARLVSRLRTQPHYAQLSVREVYSQRRLDAIAAAMARVRRRKEPSIATRRAVSRRYHFWCGVAQACIVPVLVFLHISDWLAAFFTYHLFTGDEDDSIIVAALLSVGVFLLAQGLLFATAITGKWLLVGRVKSGRYRLWGLTYFRWWLADKLHELSPIGVLAGTPLLRWYLRAMGARIGRDVYIDALDVRVPDLLTIEEGASVGMGVHIENARVEGGELVIGSVHLGPQAVVDSYAVLENDTAIGAGARLGGLSALASSQRIPAGETWEGAPARRAERVVEPLPPRPVVSPWVRWAQVVYFVLAGMAVSALFFMLLFPTFMLIDWMDMHLWNLTENHVSPVIAFAVYFLLAIPASLLLVIATILLTAALRRLLLPRQVAGVWSIHSLAYSRKWLLGQVLEGSLDVLHGLYASVFAPAWLRLMGATVGRDAEVSTSAGIIPDLLTLGAQSFIADGVLLGDEEQRNGWIVLRPTAVGSRSFVGNGAYVPDGAVIPDEVLIGVQTRTPDNHQLQSGQTWLGSPALLLPARECLTGFADTLTFHPSPWRRVGRAVVESLRIVLPMALVIAMGYVIVLTVMPLAEDDQWLQLALALALASCLFGLTSFLLVLGLKWILVGRYRPRAAPMWTPFVWFSEAVTNLYESLAVSNLLVFLRGTPFLPWTLRLLGARMGKRIYLDTTDFTEFDCVCIGDEAELNGGCGPQTHLFEDRVMKIGQVEIGARALIGSYSTILYDTQVGDRVRLGPLTLVAKGERLPVDTRWEGSPAAPVQEG